MESRKITKESLSKTIFTYEIIGFGIIIIFLWLDEIFDIPHYLFRSKVTPVNLSESIFETVIIICLSIVIIKITMNLLRKVHYLEGFLHVCSMCKRIRVKDDWIPIEDFIKEHSEALYTESLCPKCIDAYYGGF